jgi:hypothetical protein
LERCARHFPSSTAFDLHFVPSCFKAEQFMFCYDLTDFLMDFYNTAVRIDDMDFTRDVSQHSLVLGVEFEPVLLRKPRISHLMAFLNVSPRQIGRFRKENVHIGKPSTLFVKVRVRLVLLKCYNPLATHNLPEHPSRTQKRTLVHDGPGRS